MHVLKARLAGVLDRFGVQRVLVLGDLMLDRYIYGRVRRISQEAPVPVVAVSDEVEMPGGASNVALNLRALGAGAAVAGWVGADAGGARLEALLAEAGVDISAVARQDGLRTTVKERIVAEHQQVVRVDWDATPCPDAAAVAAWHAAMARVVGTVTGAVIEDYGKGAVTQAAVDQLLAACRAAQVPVGYDPKEDHPLEVAGIALATPNRREACLAAGLQEPTLLPPPLEDEVLLAAAAKLLAIWQPELLAVTLGPDGMLLFDRTGRRDLIPTVAREVFDVSGAGDTVIATALLARVAGAAPIEAALLANLAAGVVVGKVGTATCSMAELRAALADWTPS